VNGDGRIDLLLTSVGSRGTDAGLVYELLSNGDGRFTLGPMQILRGRGWLGDIFDDVRVGDVTGDHRDELVFMENLVALDHDRVIVVADPSATGGGPPGGPPPSNPVDCETLSGAAGAACLCAAGLHPAACVAVTLPAKISNGFERACAALAQSAGAKLKTQRKLHKKAIKRLSAALHLTGRKKIARKLTEPCDGAVRDTLGALRTDTIAARNALAR
jgi:hypothetical protein